MQLEDYWGIGPKTCKRLESELGKEAALEAIESADLRALLEAGLSRGRATQILRRAIDEKGMEILETRDARTVYKDLLALASAHAVTKHAEDRIRVLTPLRTRSAMEARLDRVMEATRTWQQLDAETRAAILDAFEDYDSVSGGKQTAVELARSLAELGLSSGTFQPLGEIDADVLAEAAQALGALDDSTVREGVDGTLDRLRDSVAEIERLEGSAFDVLESVREQGIRDPDELRSAVVQYLGRETDATVDAIRRATPEEAADAADFIGETLRSLKADLEDRVERREETVRAEIESELEDTREDVEAAIGAIDEITLDISLARFAIEYDLVRPTYTEEHAIAVENARNLGLAATEEEIQPIDYGLGAHEVGTVPTEDRVAVLTGANSGGKTTLLETLCHVSILASMGLPVPADRATVSVVDSIVFHRRHSSFNAGVLESTLRSIVPPLAGGGRTLMLVDEFEAITEPGSAADLLHGLVTLTVERDALGVFVTHLADDLRPLPEVARIDGIFAEGLSQELELIVDYQPRFDELGRSTPEFIVSRLVANATTRSERTGFERLAESQGNIEIQQTLEDASWNGDD